MLKKWICHCFALVCIFTAGFSDCSDVEWSSQFTQSDCEKLFIDRVLEKKIILCTGPSLRRKESLKKNTESDLQFIPFKKIFLSTNDPEIMDITFGTQQPVCQLLQDRGHQLDCLNCIITTIKNAANDPECKDDDIIIFKHESVFINDMHLVRQAIKKLCEGYDMVVRLWTPDSFYMTNVFFIKVSAARKVFTHLDELSSFNEDYLFCEDYFTKGIVNLIPNVYKIDYSHFTRKDNELGFFHIPPKGEEDWEGYWDKANYDELYR